ncbi:uncharacterized protein LOC108738495 [Agrilus planipennis]|uniref:Uncharacterized protein LOC108738495 n=1 Tax=Agrilus planipennis TaxID=224129 RepID=A0A1W4X4X3_AGRPL|nr:uncharacterized protein LOC108738495 [Agrilus planipennis]
MEPIQTLREKAYSQTERLNDENVVYYAVRIPPEQKVDHDAYAYIFENKSEAINLLKKHKKARFKSFALYNDAVKFVVYGVDSPSLDTTDNGTQTIITECLPVGEKPILFKMPKSQDLVKFRKNIESGYVHLVEKAIWENPRYLIGNGDTPTILQEGFRYNALHIAARTKSWKMADVVLNTISDISFIQLLYGDDGYQNSEERSKVLLDLYLNTPDKGLNETPLHFASKFGAVEVVEVLVSFSVCDKTAKNKYGKTAAEVICSRYNDSNVTSTKKRIATLLEDNFYVPLIKSENNCTVPIIGEPFSPKSPLNYNSNPLQPRLEIHAYAGPLNKEEADRFRKIWKTPPRSLKSTKTDDFPKTKSTKGDGVASAKDFETIGRELAAKYDIGWKEYWPFLGMFLNLASQEGLQQLEQHLETRTYHSCNMVSWPFCPAFEKTTTTNDRKRVSIFESNNTNLNRCFDRDNDLPEISSFLVIEKSCRVFANRLSNEILLLKDTNFNTICLEMSVKHLQTLIGNLSNDNRFEGINLKRVHHRIGYLVAHNLEQVLQQHEKHFVILKLHQWLENSSELCDNLPTLNSPKQSQNCHSIEQQTTCLLQCLLMYMDNEGSIINDSIDENYVKALSDGELCSCKWESSRTEKSYKHNNSVVRRLSFQHSVSETDHADLSNTNVNEIEYESSDDEYYTPCSSPITVANTMNDNDIFEEAVSYEEDVFIEGIYPTSTDVAVFKALKHIENLLNPVDYPYVYKWHHAMRIYLGRNKNICTSPIKEEGSTRHHQSASIGTPKSWIRITGVNSPRTKLSFLNDSLSKLKVTNVKDK